MIFAALIHDNQQRVALQFLEGMAPATPMKRKTMKNPESDGADNRVSLSVISRKGF